MAFDEYLPRNSESRCIGQSIRMIKKNAPHIKWIISFADGAQCGDGTIYRASNFVLTGIKKNNKLWKMPTGDIVSRMTLTANCHQNTVADLCKKMNIKNIYRKMTDWENLGAVPIEGYQLRYIYFIDKRCREKLTVPVLPFSAIDEMGAGMYRGERISQAERHK